jgi:hypothetical protein
MARVSIAHRRAARCLAQAGEDEKTCGASDGHDVLKPGPTPGADGRIAVSVGGIMATIGE